MAASSISGDPRAVGKPPVPVRQPSGHKLQTHLNPNLSIRNNGVGVKKRRGLVSLLITSLVGVGFIVMSLYIGNSYMVTGIAAVFAFFAVAFSRKSILPVLFLISWFVAIPTNWPAALPCNLVFAIWLLLFRGRQLARLSRWQFILAALGLLAMLLGSMNWVKDNALLNFAQQSAYLFNFLLGPIIVIPFMYQGLSGESYASDKLRLLLFCLILPSTLVLLAVYAFGKPILHMGIRFDQQAGMMVYQLGNVEVDFIRTHVGIVLAGLICASVPVIALPLAGIYRLVAVICMASNFFLLLVTGSVGSILSGLIGCMAMLFFMVRRVRIDKVLFAGIALIGLLLVVWRFAPDNVHQYIEQRYEQRFGGDGKGEPHVNAEDRLQLWSRAIDYLAKYPEGVGWSISYGDYVKANSHNDYLLFAICYGVLGGLIYLYLVIRLVLYFVRHVKRFKQPADIAIHLAGLGTLTVLATNSMFDHLAANRWYFNVLWSIVWACYLSGYHALSKKTERPA